MKSSKYKHWLAKLDARICPECKLMHGKIYSVEKDEIPELPIHSNCRCVIEWLNALIAGTATNKGNNGADWWLKWAGKLPDYYITKTEAQKLGYNPMLGNLAKVAPGKMIGKGIYKNRNTHLPQEEGRVWYEADINYVSGYRGPIGLFILMTD